MTFAAFAPSMMVMIATLVGALVVALYWLRQRPRRVIVSNIDFWIRAAEKTRPRWLWSVQIPWLPLLLSLAVALGMVALLGDPRFAGGIRGATVIVVDAGRSMGAVDSGGEARIDAAFREVDRIVLESTVAGRVAVLRAGMRPSVMLPWTERAAEWQRGSAGRSGEVDEGPSNVAAALDLAEALLSEEGAADSGQIVVITDHGLAGDTHSVRGADVRGADVRGADVRGAADGRGDDARGGGAASRLFVLAVGERAETVGITRFAARRVPEAVGEYVVICEVHAWTTSPAKMRLRIFERDVVIVDQAIDLAPHRGRVITASGFSSADALLRAELSEIELEESFDAVALDDRAFAVVEGLSALRVLLASRGNRYLEAALAAHPGLEVDIISRLDGLSVSDLAAYHVLVLDGVELPENLTHQGVVWFGPPESTSRIERGGTLEDPPITATFSSHPALRGLALDDLSIRRSGSLITRDGDDVLIRSGEEVLSLAREDHGARWVVFGFSPEQTSLVGREEFPVLVHRVLSWATARDEMISLPIRVGAELRAAAGTTIEDPDGTRRSSNGWVPEVRRAGPWRVGDHSVATTSVDYARAVAVGATGGRFMTPNSVPPLTVLIAALVVSLLLVEWALFHRGVLS